MGSIGDKVRSLLNIRATRSTLPRTHRPRIGARAIRGELRMTLQAGLSDELWNWLQDRGWREVQFSPDRRRYKDIPVSYVHELIDAQPSEWGEVLIRAMAAARQSGRPIGR